MFNPSAFTMYPKLPIKYSIIANLPRIMSEYNIAQRAQ